MSGSSCFSMQLLAVGRSWEWMDAAAAAARGWEKLPSREGGGGAALGALSHPKSGSMSYRHPRCREPWLVSDQQMQPGMCTHPMLDVVAELQSNTARHQAVRLPTCCRAVTHLPNLVGGCEQAGAC